MNPTLAEAVQEILLKHKYPTLTQMDESKATQAIIKAVKDRLPEKQNAELEAKLKIIGYHEQFVKGFNSALDQLHHNLFGDK